MSEPLRPSRPKHRRRPRALPGGAPAEAGPAAIARDPNVEDE
ncbi:hypothetical protein [Actinomadura sp. GTD37]